MIKVGLMLEDSEIYRGCFGILRKRKGDVEQFKDCNLLPV
jgi:hypothetical protein